MATKRQPSTPAVARQRARAFRAALALKGMTALEFAEAAGVHRTHLYLVLRGDRSSERLTALVDKFIAKHTPTFS
jgi:transcriptional regulator with XRE-family HTH domain